MVVSARVEASRIGVMMAATEFALAVAYPYRKFRVADLWSTEKIMAR